MHPKKAPAMSLLVQIPSVEYSAGEQIPVTIILRNAPSIKIRSVHVRLIQRDRKKVVHQEKLSHLGGGDSLVTYEMELAIPRNATAPMNSRSREQSEELFEVEVCVRTGLLKCYEVRLPVRIKRNEAKKCKHGSGFLVPKFAFK